MEKTVLKYARQGRLEGVTPRTLHHTFGKSALDAGVDLVTVSRLLGHARLETTAIYTTPPTGTWSELWPSWSRTR